MLGNNDIPTGSGNLKFENAVYSFIGFSGIEKAKYADYIEAKGGEVCEPCERTQYIIYSPGNQKNAKYWPEAIKRDKEGSIFIMIPEVFTLWTQKGYRIDNLKLDKKILLCLHYLKYRKNWENDLFDVNNKIEKFLPVYALRLTKELYNERNIEALGCYFDFLAEKEKEWKDTGYSDGFYTYSLVNKYETQAVKDKDRNMISFLLEYKASHFDERFTEAAQSNDIDIKFGLKEIPAVYYQPGASFFMGRYYKSDDYVAEKEPVEWEVLKQEDGKALVVSKLCIDAEPFNRKCSSVTWENSSIRKWLNGRFYSEAFSEEEKEKIAAAHIQNLGHEYYGTHGGNDTDDNIFLLSEDEAENLFIDDAARIKKATPYAISRGAKTDNDGNGWWWLRSPGVSGSHAADINSYGAVYDAGNYVYITDGCVCPAFWLKITG